MGSGLPTSYRFGGLVFQEGGYASDFWMPSHAHEEARLVLILQGAVKHACRKQTSLLAPSTLTLIPGEEPHTDHFQEGVKAFIIGLEPHWLARHPQVAPFLDTPAIHQNGLPNWLAMRLYREFQQRDNLTSLMLEGLTLELLTEMARSETYGAENSLPRWLRQARDFLHVHFTETLSVEAVAAVVGVHPSHLMRAFRRHYRLSIGDYVRKLRVEYACHLLASSELFPAQVAHTVGFAHVSHFCRTFKSLTGMTPSEFQKASGRAIPR